MKFLKNFNNNAALVVDDQDVEWIVVGNGVGFGKHKGDQIDEQKIQRRFVATLKQNVDIDSFQDLKPQSFAITTQVVHLVEPLLKVSFSDYQYFVLADHIDFALKRANDGIDVDNGTVRWEVKKLFPKEFQAATKAVELINSTADVTLPKSEVVFMTYHFINAGSDGSKLQETIKITKLISGIIDIVQYQFQMRLDPESFNYNRFVAHLRALMVQRVSRTSSTGSELDQSLLQLMIAKYPQAYATVERIDTFLQSKAGWRLEPDDKVYLTLHIWRVTHRQKSE
ncbi:PRD domain-containing protein [Lactiplantibacillus pentosus]|uniref:PRD domain-containing protein n=1 Tax=Lactiplantibacillus pentosus TaxID=1589 RepID=A0AB37RGY2_LACPE|nr:PRD domain-containing protein [Lactiplantibacillus pentosus]MDO7803892.1 PRD domain-containing protein [Lactiplantibacillus pentosus]RMW42379.1 PRD domain-containing protein [Lactiplantibacillus pentosus]RMW48451.1 PRD domain-containing protein [Lactiplantibacillus pentosus]RMW52588.1 PRD domain-containing protein [Lactiplantibacillus pentosus]RMW55322.1 PRD domain-containing protein [Lactiplantibacillus pentosus]